MAEDDTFDVDETDFAFAEGYQRRMKAFEKQSKPAKRKGVKRSQDGVEIDGVQSSSDDSEKYESGVHNVLRGRPISSVNATLNSDARDALEDAEIKPPVPEWVSTEAFVAKLRQEHRQLDDLLKGPPPPTSSKTPATAFMSVFHPDMYSPLPTIAADHHNPCRQLTPDESEELDLNVSTSPIYELCYAPSRTLAEVRAGLETLGWRALPDDAVPPPAAALAPATNWYLHLQQVASVRWMVAVLAQQPENAMIDFYFLRQTQS
jgi:hypothetical protein